VLTPGGKTRSVQTAPAGKQRSGAVSLNEVGVHIVRLTLQRPRAPRPSYEAKTLLLTQGAQDDPTRYAVGRGLELVPGQPISRLAQGDTLALFVLLDGKRVSASIEALAEGGRNVFLKATEAQPALLKVSGSGRYLVTGSIKGRGCSLVFMVRSAGKETP